MTAKRAAARACLVFLVCRSGFAWVHYRKSPFLSNAGHSVATVRCTSLRSHNNGVVSTYDGLTKKFGRDLASGTDEKESVLSRIFSSLLLSGLEAALLHQFDKLLDSWQDTKDHLANHNYLNGNFAPVAEEHICVPLGVVEGALPKDLDGLFVRNGPNPIPSQMTKRYHWFDGHGMLHNIRFQSHPHPSATYSNQFIPTPRYQIEKTLGEEIFWHIAEITGVIGLVKLALVHSRLGVAHGLNFLTIGQANSHTTMYKNKFWCGHENSLPFEVQLDSDGRIVKAIGFEDFGGNLDFPVAEHPRKDPISGNLMFHGYSADPDLLKRYGPLKVGEYDGNRDELISYLGVSPNDKHISFAHDLVFTKHWIVIFDSSVHFAADIVSRILDPNGGSFFEFNSDATLRIGLVPRGRDNQTLTHHDVVWIDTGAAHVITHPLNAWEDVDGTVVLWTPIGDHFDGSFTTTTNTFHMNELRLDPNLKRLVSKKLIDPNYNVEYSHVREDKLGRFCRFGYSGIYDPCLGGETLCSGFLVWDMEKGELIKAVKYPNNEVGQEPVVIPKLGRAESNAVYLGTFLYSSKGNQSFFVLYDGENDYGVVAKLRVPHRVPFGFHGQWVTGEDLQAHIDYHQSKSS